MTLKFAWHLFLRARTHVKSSALLPARNYHISSCLCDFSNIRSSSYVRERAFVRFAGTVAAQSKSPSTSTAPLHAKSRFRFDILRNMAAQLAKPFTIYVAPGATSGDDSSGKRTFRIMFRFAVNSAADGDLATKSTDQLLNFERDYDDPLEATLTRIRMKLVSLHERASGNKKRGKRAKFSTSDVGATKPTNHGAADWNLRVVTADGTELAEDVTNEAAFLTEGRSLMVNDQSYQILGPTPSITKAEVDIVPLVGYPVMPSVNVTEDSSVDTCQYFWFTGESSNLEISAKSKAAASIEVTCDHDEVSGAVRIREMKGWTLKSTDRVYIPDENDAGRHLCLVVAARTAAGRFGLPRIWTTPLEKPKSSGLFQKGVVIVPPAPMIWTERHRLCAEWAARDRIRCVSYNILADLYMNLTIPDEELYFPYCPKQYQEHSYRYPLLLKEISGYRGDLYCLQEVDTRMYDRFLEPYLSMQGWRGITKRKGGVVNEGSAIFYRPEKLELVDSDDHVLSDLISKSDFFADLAQVAKQSEAVWNIFLTRPATVQVAVFRCLTAPNSYICVANTHLHFKPHHSPIRLLQAALGYRHLLYVVSRVEEQYPKSTVAAIFCGDFNSTPRTGVYEMFQNGRLGAEHPDWQPQVDDVEEKYSSKEDTEEPMEVLAVQGIDLKFSKPLKNACPSVQYTTSTHVFRDTLDYVFVSDNLVVDRVIPMPAHELVTKYAGIPSPICPSDHLALVCELKLC